MTITIQEAEKLRADNIRLREALSFYDVYVHDLYTSTDSAADHADCVLDVDRGFRARTTLRGDTPPSPDVPAFDAWYQTRFPAIPKQTREYQMAKAAFAAGQASVKGGE